VSYIVVAFRISTVRPTRRAKCVCVCFFFFAMVMLMNGVTV